MRQLRYGMRTTSSMLQVECESTIETLGPTIEESIEVDVPFKFQLTPARL